MLLVVALAFVAAALMVALVSLSPRSERLRVPHRTMVGLDRRRLQVQRGMRVSEALAHHQRRLDQQRAELRLSLATEQAPLPRAQWSRPDPAVGVRRGISLPMQPIAPYWQNWAPAPSAPSGYGTVGYGNVRYGNASYGNMGYSYMNAAAPPVYLEPQARAS
jgi:hypothetical protein